MMNWEYVVEREGSFLKNYLLHESFSEHADEIGFDFLPFLTVRNGNVFTHYVDFREQQDKQKLFKEKGVRFVVDKGTKCAEELLQFTQEVAGMDFVAMSNYDVIKLVKNYFELYKKPYPYFLSSSLLADGLSQKDCQSLADLRLMVRRVYNQSHMLMDSFFVELAQRIGFSSKNLYLLSPQEIIYQLQLHSSTSRRENCYFHHEGGSFNLVEGASAIRSSVDVLGDEQQGGILQGLGLGEGVYEGIVRVVHTADELSQLQSGEILVTKMTLPDFFVSCIEKALVIVTDEGGITCHAAVLSKEFTIPVVIGTKHATKKLQTGDQVKVDVSKGVVEKLQ